MITLIKWKLLKHRLGLPLDARLYDKGSKWSPRYYEDNVAPKGLRERLDYWLATRLGV